MSSVLRLTLLSPDIIDAILDGRQPSGLTLAVPMQPFAVAWDAMAVVIRKRQQIAFHIAANFSISFLGPRTSI